MSTQIRIDRLAGPSPTAALVRMQLDSAHELRDGCVPEIVFGRIAGASAMAPGGLASIITGAAALKPAGLAPTITAGRG